MSTLLRYCLSLWDKISHIGTAGKPYAEARRIVLTNQIAFLGGIVPHFYNLFYFLHNYELLKMPIMVNVVGSFICLGVLSLNYKQYTQLAKYVIIIVPNIQIFLLTYYLSTASGMHLLHIMMISFVLFLLSNEKKVVIVTMSALPLILYILSFVLFSPEVSPISLDPDILKVFFIIISITVFLLVMLFFMLFYKEILRTEKLLQTEYERSERLLLNILPDEVAQRLKTNPDAIVENISSATILFADIVGFTGITTSLSPADLLAILNEVFSRFDKLVEKYGMEKIKTIGDAYMVAGGVPVPIPGHTVSMAHLALDMLNEIDAFHFGDKQIGIRIGFHTGPVVAGVIGKKKFSYDIWGEAVNYASRLESHGNQGKIHVSREVYGLLKDQFSFIPRGVIFIKGLGEQETYFLTGRLSNNNN